MADGSTTRAAVALLVAGLWPASAGAEVDVEADGPILEEIVVTGSYVPRSREDGALPVDVISRAQLEAEGNPSFVELVRNLSYAGGSLGETNQLQRGDALGVQGINLRSLGGPRTLVLLNGRRHAAFQEFGGDLAVLPQQALQRLEILKDGAAALYGSDAMAGVVNLITRNSFRGVELHGGYGHVEHGGSGDAGILVGTGDDRWDWVTSLELRRRNRVATRDRDWALPAYADNPAGGFSSIAHPARYLPAIDGTVLGAGGPDPGCALLGETVTGLDCQFQYAVFDNVIEEEDNLKLFSELNGETDAGLSLHVEALYGRLEQPDVASSPSYPPRSLFTPDRYVPRTHPGLVDMKAQHPELFGPLFGIPAQAQGAFVINRAEGVTGQRGEPGELSASTESLRLAAALSGPLARRPVNFELAVSWSRYRRRQEVFDTYVERMAFALDGLGGPGCDPATGAPGVGPCEYYNPFSNGIERSVVNGAGNPGFDPAVANSADLLDWLRGAWSAGSDNDLLVLDAGFSGELGWSLLGGRVQWAGGLQYRREAYRTRVDDLANLAVNPCPFRDPTSLSLGHTDSLECSEPTGLFGFVVGRNETDFQRSVYAAYAELSLPLLDSLNVQLAARTERYEGSLGTTVDPKLAFRWQPLPWLALRGSASTTFRAPYLDMLDGRETSLVFVPAALQWKGVVTFGNPELEPERALATSSGVLIEAGGLEASVDFWRFNITKALAPEPAALILGAYSALGCFDDGPGVGTPECVGLRDNVFPIGVAPAAVERMEVSWTNPVDTEHAGVDVIVRYRRPLGPGDMTLGLEATYGMTWAPSSNFRERDGVTLIPKGLERVGHLNSDAGGVLPAMPRIKGFVRAGYRLGAHALNYRLRYVHHYQDDNAPIPVLAQIDAHVTHDLHYHWQARRNLRVTLSAINLLDADPPRTATYLSYDPYIHNPAGRMVKLGLTARIGID